MTDNEIIKALECCGKTVSENCKECPLHLTDCLKVNIDELALDLINRQKAEIERLNAVVDKADAEVGALLEKLNATIAGQETLQKYIAEKNEDIDWARKRILEADKTIDKQNAKIDRLKSLLNEKAFELAEDRKNEIKSEAIKECIEKVKETSNKMELVCNGALVQTDYTITEKKLDNILKELVGD